MSGKRLGRRGLAAAALVALVLAGAACSGSDAESEAAGVAVPAGGDADSAGDGGNAGGGGGSIGSPLRRGTPDDTAAYEAGETIPDAYLVSGAERIIKTAELRLDVGEGKIARSLKRGREIAEEAGGFLLSTSIDGTDRARAGFTIRVPVERFEETLGALEDLGELAGEDVRGEDVSQEFVDLEARLRNATAQEEVLFRLYDRSETVADTIRVQRELEDVQLEIERLRGRLRYLEDRTSLSTISVSLRESGAVAAEAGPFGRAWRNARATFVAVVAGAIVGAGYVLPILGFALLAYVLFRLVRPRLQRATP